MSFWASSSVLPDMLRIVIAGGGTAGWMAANLIAHAWREKPVSVTLVESSDIPTVGVGEGSTPTLKRFFAELGIAEADWMPQCHATYKVNIRFRNWSPASGINHYSHPFLGQLDTFSERAFHVNCHTRRLGLDVRTRPDDFLFNGWLAREHRVPIPPEHFPFRIEYGYHFDSALLGRFLRDHAARLGVERIEGNINEINTTPAGNIAALQLADGRNVDGDFFIDCTGFRSLLLQQTLGVAFESFSDNLFNDSAVVIPTGVSAELPVETTSTALSAGWAWSIPLTHRTGNGYVYASAFISHDQAEAELRQHLRLSEHDGEARILSMRVGQVAEHWHRNCLALGLAQGFIEPLEATALHLVQLSVEHFIEQFDKAGFTPDNRDAYNREISERFSRVRDYIVAHYKLNTRNDSDYWRQNRDNMTLSDSLLQLLDVWYRKGDLPAEIIRQDIQQHFGLSSWHCLLAGYGVFPPVSAQQPGTGDLYDDKALDHFFRGCLQNFSTQRDYLNLAS